MSNLFYYFKVEMINKSQTKIVPKRKLAAANNCNVHKCYFNIPNNLPTSQTFNFQKAAILKIIK